MCFGGGDYWFAVTSGRTDKDSTRGGGGAVGRAHYDIVVSRVCELVIRIVVSARPMRVADRMGRRVHGANPDVIGMWVRVLCGGAAE